MKFRFCGEGDCPDWVLAEIISTLSNLTTAKLEKLTSIVSKNIIGYPIEEEQIKSIAADFADDGKSAVACIDFILVNAARYNIDEGVLLEELQQLGLPRLHASAICCVLMETKSTIKQKLISSSFKINELDSVEYKHSGDIYDAVLLELKITNQLIDGLPRDETHTISIDQATLFTLLRDMKEARNILQKHNKNN